MSKEISDISALDYIKQVKKKNTRGVIANHKDDVILLDQHGLTLVQIQDFLASKGVNVQRSSIHRLLKRHKLAEEKSVNLKPKTEVQPAAIQETITEDDQQITKTSSLGFSVTTRKKGRSEREAELDERFKDPMKNNPLAKYEPDPEILKNNL